MASRLKVLGIDGVVIAVDTWLGSRDHWVLDHFETLGFVNGRPVLQNIFMTNVITQDLEDYVVPLPLDSLNAIQVLHHHGIRFGLVHLGAGRTITIRSVATCKLGGRRSALEAFWWVMIIIATKLAQMCGGPFMSFSAQWDHYCLSPAIQNADCASRLCAIHLTVIVVRGTLPTNWMEGMLGTIALCAIFKNEKHFLLEWIAFHKLIGVDHFVLFDNASTDGGNLLIRNSGFSRDVTLIDWADHPGQITAYRHYINHHARRFTWSGFIDIDEFIHPLGTSSLSNLLDHPMYTGFSAILLNWLIFGPSDHDRRPADLVMESYVRRLPVNDPGNRHVKSLVRSAHLQGVGSTPHIFATTGPACTPLGIRVPGHAIQEAVCDEVMLINHYFTKSREDWIVKLERGRSDQPDDLPVQYDMGMFNTISSGSQKEDRRITRFVLQLQSLLKQSRQTQAPFGSPCPVI
jgi:hypothetical protein